PLNFSVDASDHCETPRAAYADIAPLLDVLARRSVPGAPARARLAISTSRLWCAAMTSSSVKVISCTV
ncbi:MAG: hypothetical protein QMB23_01445, partial [Candidatus Nanopelagicales bacterium]